MKQTSTTPTIVHTDALTGASFILATNDLDAASGWGSFAHDLYMTQNGWNPPMVESTGVTFCQACGAYVDQHDDSTDTLCEQCATDCDYWADVQSATMREEW